MDKDECLAEALNLEKTGKAFRFSAKSVFLTYKTHLDKERLNRFFKDIAHERSVPTYMLRCYIAHEAGTADTITPYLHTHVLLKFNVNIDTKNCRFFDFNGIHPHISKVKSWEKSCIYISKEDLTCREEVVKGDPPKKKELTGGNALEYGDMTKAMSELPLKFATAVKTVYECRPLETRDFDFDPLPWQSDLMIKIQKCSDRKVIWVYDPVGAAGKSELTSDMTLNHGKDWLFCDDLGGPKDIANLLFQAVRGQSWNGYGFVMDMTRDEEDHKIYRSLERVKRGLMTNTKFSCGSFPLPQGIPRVVIFSNWLPMWKKFTEDRWEIYQLRRASDPSRTPVERFGSGWGSKIYPTCACITCVKAK